MSLNINALDLLWMALAVIAYAAGATLWAYLALPREQRLPRAPALPAKACFEAAPLDDIPPTHARLAK